ncbi:MAG TPA: hypothetical protein PKD86_15135 [Gemmatales bacterium]|nr:hypothetical protein [Gemmatales bacterium]HMP60677.1 hypothetical protein [Gemmatales bacterium]
MAVSFADIAVGSTYSRNDLVRLWEHVGVEAISRGVVTPQEDNKIILFVTLDKHPSARPYEDETVGPVLLWEGPNDHLAEDRMLAHQETGDEVHLFYRQRPWDDFTYAGQLVLYCCQRFPDRPSWFVFRICCEAV